MAKPLPSIDDDGPCRERSNEQHMAAATRRTNSMRFIKATSLPATPDRMLTLLLMAHARQPAVHEVDVAALWKPMLSFTTVAGATGHGLASAMVSVLNSIFSSHTLFSRSLTNSTVRNSPAQRRYPKPNG